MKRTKSMKLATAGGRIKSAAIGLGDFYKFPQTDLEAEFKKLRQEPPLEILKAFFPSDRIRMKKMLRGVGFYRPTLKTDQGMGGNFLPFSVDEGINKTDLSSKKINQEEYLALPETWYNHSSEVVVKIQGDFYKNRFKEIYQRLGNMETRTAGKGRTPFFFIRPAETDKPIIFGRDIVQKVEATVNKFLGEIIQEAMDLEESRTGKCHAANIIYCQPDVYISAKGEVTVEKIHLPDVGMFMNGFCNPYSTILPKVQNIISELTESVIKAFNQQELGKKIYIITRSEVIDNEEDLLEIGEIREMATRLATNGYQVIVRGVNNISDIPKGTAVILMNINYSNPSASSLLNRHSSGELVCYPNPFVQMVAQSKIGLKNVVIPRQFQAKFLDLLRSQPKSSKGEIDVRSRIEKTLCQHGITGDILHIDTGVEVIPVFRHLLHSWRQVALRAKKWGYSGIRIIELPIDRRFPNLLSSSTGPRLHVFRFMLCS